jgi:DNA modification methylase/transcriptional regulator with XRE-family HTH domain
VRGQSISQLLGTIRARAGLSQEALARTLGVSFVSVNRWERGAASPSPAIAQRIEKMAEAAVAGRPIAREADVFASRGVRGRSGAPLALTEDHPAIELWPEPGLPILERIASGRLFTQAREDGESLLAAMLGDSGRDVPTASAPPQAGMTAGKNTYTYDAHTYHTKVPPQGIAELLRHYLPAGGLVLDPFAGSGMTGVAARALGADCILNELSPAACFIASRFCEQVDATAFRAAIAVVMAELAPIRQALYTTTCRECSRDTEAIYYVWSYRVACPHCETDFQLWDVCRRYGKTVREHEILSTFPCPSCSKVLQKSRLNRLSTEPVLVGYKCCGSRQQEVTHPLSPRDLALIEDITRNPPVVDGYYPTTPLPDGVNLRQPRKHGLDRVDLFYTARNLAALSHLWNAAHRLADPQLAAHVAFVCTSLYQRVTRLSEFRFWGGSGNTARFNVPFISNETNVFITFERKARTICDHLEATATHYRGRALVVNGSATSLDLLPDASVDVVFTDPPFGANINYSEMNILWESWLGRFTDTTHEAIINRFQNKDVESYQQLMTDSLRECHRVLKPGRWLLLVFMNSASSVWRALSEAVANAGFKIVQVDIFDKQHGTFKQFVSDNTAGYDLVLHCQKTERDSRHRPRESRSLAEFLKGADLESLRTVYLHVGREDELDVRRLYSEWVAKAMVSGEAVIDLRAFRAAVGKELESRELQKRNT